MKKGYYVQSTSSESKEVLVIEYQNCVDRLQYLSKRAGSLQKEESIACSWFISGIIFAASIVAMLIGMIFHSTFFSILWFIGHILLIIKLIWRISVHYNTGKVQKEANAIKQKMDDLEKKLDPVIIEEFDLKVEKMAGEMMDSPDIKHMADLIYSVYSNKLPKALASSCTHVDCVLTIEVNSACIHYRIDNDYQSSVDFEDLRLESLKDRTEKHACGTALSRLIEQRISLEKESELMDVKSSRSPDCSDFKCAYEVVYTKYNGSYKGTHSWRESHGEQ